MEKKWLLFKSVPVSKHRTKDKLFPRHNISLLETRAVSYGFLSAHSNVYFWLLSWWRNEKLYPFLTLTTSHKCRRRTHTQTLRHTNTNTHNIHLSPPPICLSPRCFQRSRNSWQVSSSGVPSALFHNTQTHTCRHKEITQSASTKTSKTIARPCHYTIKTVSCIRFESLHPLWIIDWQLPSVLWIDKLFGKLDQTPINETESTYTWREEGSHNFISMKFMLKFCLIINKALNKSKQQLCQSTIRCTVKSGSKR